MQQIKTIILATACSIGFAAPSLAAVITFDEFGLINDGSNGGEVTGNEWAASGVVFSTPDLQLNLGATTGSAPNALGADVSNNDFDGQININFTGGLSYTDVMFTIFNTPFQAQAFDIGGSLLTTLTSGTDFTQLFDFSGFAVNKLVVTGSFYAIDDLSFSTVSTVPVPAGLPLLTGGLALMGFVGSRRRKARK